MVNKVILFGRNSELFTFNDTTNTDTQITNFTQNGTLSISTTQGSWNADKTKILFLSTKDNPRNEIYTANPDGTSVTRLTNDMINDLFAKFSPDGSKVAFVRQLPNITYSPKPGELYIMNSDGSNVKQLTDLNSNNPISGVPVNIQDICWNGNTEIYFVSNWKSFLVTSNIIYKYQFNIVTTVSVLNNVGYKQNMDISPDNQRLVYLKSLQMGTQTPNGIYKCKIDGTGEQKLTSFIQDGTVYKYTIQPSWTQDGKILFLANMDEENGEIYRMDSVGVNIMRVTNNHLVESLPRVR
ncbi:MAG: hypothetical protein ABJA37_08595 [Ferruginibacter sp.]